MRRRYALRKECIIALKLSKGGCCQLCGYDQCITALEFHHKDRKTKKKTKYTSVSQMLINGSIALGKKEVELCILLCANCHRYEEAKSSALQQMWEQVKGAARAGLEPAVAYAAH